jgi:hypothetical protein
MPYFSLSTAGQAEVSNLSKMTGKTEAAAVNGSRSVELGRAWIYALANGCA